MITIITLQDPSNSTSIGAHTLQFVNWDLSANSNFNRFITNQTLFKADDNSNRLVSNMQLMSGIPTLQSALTQDNSSVNIPIAIIDSSFALNTFSDTTDASDSFINYMIVLGSPILVNIGNAFTGNLTNIQTNKLNWRSLGSNNGSSANNIWLDENNAYADDLLTLKLNNPIILIPGISYNVRNTTSQEKTFASNKISSNNTLEKIFNSKLEVTYP